MAVIDSKGIKNDSGTIKSQTVTRERTSQGINRPASRRGIPTSSLANRRSGGNSGSRNNYRKGNLNRNNNLRKNRNIAKPAGSNDDEKLNPLQKAQQNRRPLNQQASNSRSNVNERNPQEEEQRAQEEQRQTQEQPADQLNKPENELEQNKNSSTAPQAPSDKEDSKEDEGDGKGSGLGKKLLNFIKKHPTVLLGIAGALLFFFLGILLIAIITSIFGNVATSIPDEEYEKNYGPFFAFDSASISLVDPTGTIPVSRKALSLSEYLKGIIYADTMNLDFSSMTDDQIKEFYKALIVARKSQVLSRGKYDNRSKQMTLKLTDFNYCDPLVGCKMATKNGSTFYLSNDLTLDVDRTSTEYGAIKDNLLLILNVALAEVKSQVATPNNVEEPLTIYKWAPISVTSSTISTYLNAAKSGTKYDDIIKNNNSGYKVYNLDDYVLLYESVFISLYTFWWPIGSDVPDAMGGYSGDPATTLVLSSYGPSFSTQTINKGMKIGGTCSITKVIAPKDGKVTFVGTDQRYGSYVIISHEDNVRTLLGSLNPSSIKVSVNQQVSQGDLIGIVGKINEDDSKCYLYVEMYVNGQNVNPLDYFSKEYPRPSLAKYIKFVQGKDNKQTVCKTLLASGFNKAAVAGLMANIERESGFKLDALSDGGTSNGLFQWHKGRLDNLRQYCGSEYLTSIKCQLDFFLYEITEGSEKNDGAYNYLMGNHSAYEMAYQFCLLFERPAGGANSAATRGSLAESTYVSYVNNGCN